MRVFTNVAGMDTWLDPVHRHLRPSRRHGDQRGVTATNASARDGAERPVSSRKAFYGLPAAGFSPFGHVGVAVSTRWRIP